MGDRARTPRARSGVVSLILISVVSVPALAQCEDVDGDGYFGRDGCGSITDCNDASTTTYPGASEACNGVDDDCDDAVDEGCATSCPAPRPVGDPAGTSGSFWWPNIAWTGERWGLSWTVQTLDISDPFRIVLRDPDGDLVADEVATDPAADAFAGTSTWTGGEFGFAWLDNRDEVRGRELYFTRADSDGVKIGPDVRLTDRPTTSLGTPRIVWTGNEYGVAWAESRDGAYRMFFLRCDRTGAILEGPMEVSDIVAEIDETIAPPAVAWTGDGFSVAWTDRRNGTEQIFLARLDAAGNKIGADTPVVTSTCDQRSMPAIRWSGERNGLLWVDRRSGVDGAWFVPVSADGSSLGPEHRATDDHADPSGIAYYDLAWTGTEFLAAWTDWRSGNEDIYLSRLDVDGARLGRDALVRGGPRNSDAAAVHWNGKRIGVLYDDDALDGPSLSLLRCCEPAIDFDMDAASECEDCDDLDDAVRPGFDEICDFKDNDCDGLVDEGFDTDGDGYTTCDGDCDDADPAITGAWEIACNGVDEDCDGPYDDAPDADGDGFDACGPADPVNPDGLERDCNDRNANVRPGGVESCFDATDNDCDGFVDEGCGATCTSASLIDAPVRLDDPAAPGARRPTIAASGSGYGVFWAENVGSIDWWEIVYRRIDRTGSPVNDPVALTEAHSHGHPIPAWTGAEFGVIFTDSFPAKNGEIAALRIDADGAPLGPEARVTRTVEGSQPRVLAWTGRDFGLTGIEGVDWIPQFRRLDAEGRPIGGFEVLEGARIAWNGDGYGMVWADSRDGNLEIYFRTLLEDGTSAGPDVRVTSDPGPSTEPDLVWIGDSYGLVWLDRRSGFFDGLYFARIDAGGGRLTPDTALATPLANVDGHRLVWTGFEFAAAWMDNRLGLFNNRPYFMRIDLDGNALEPAFAAWDEHPASFDMTWSGTEYAMAIGSNDSDGRVLFQRIRCCGEDRDADTSGACDDCDDLNPDAFPGATEVCDLADNNCDGQIDEGFPIPGAVSGLTFTDSDNLAWDPETLADRYDVIRGDLVPLRSSGGNFATTGIVCVKNDATDTTAVTFGEPSPGEGYYLLVRAQAACQSGTWQGSGEIGDRDGSIMTATGVCP